MAATSSSATLSGLQPDVAMVALASSTATADYVPRLLEALGRPRVVVPVHWDNFETPLRNPPPSAPADADRLAALIAAVRKASPRSQVIVPSYDTPYTF
ncbi:hypothetical protein [Dactylosporangium sp. CA-139066]|uniref:hypothetical protein n=1 Tax=Dactylosporangium sp. CA-139066 TaxID=3239930 RepID=UPI003D8BE186